MRKVCVIIAMLAVMLCAPSVYAESIGVVIDQVPVQFDDSTGYPYTDENGRTLVPLRAVMEAYGLQVNYNNGIITLYDPKDRKQDQREVTFELWKNTYQLQYFSVPSQEWRFYNFQMDTVPVEKNGRTYVPARILLESFGAGVAWDPYRNLVVVRFDGVEQPIREPYYDPAKDASTSGRERFGGTIDSVGLEVVELKTTYYENWQYANKSHRNVDVTRATIVNKSGENIEWIALKYCVFDKSTNELIYQEDEIWQYWHPGGAFSWPVIIPNYDKTKHDVEILLAN